MTTSGIKLVCFDVGGVLVRHCRTWREGCLAAGLPVRDGSETEEMIRKRRELAQMLTCGQLQPWAFYRRMSEATGGAYSSAEVQRIHDGWLGPEYEGVGAVVRRLIKSGRVETGTLSNTNEPHWARFQPRDRRKAEFPTASLLRHRHASHLLGMMKPMPEIYERFEELTGFAGPEVLFLEDVPENAAPAAARGWRVELIDHTRETAGQIESALAKFGLL